MCGTCIEQKKKRKKNKRGKEEGKEKEKTMVELKLSLFDEPSRHVFSSLTSPSLASMNKLSRRAVLRKEEEEAEHARTQRIRAKYDCILV